MSSLYLETKRRLSRYNIRPRKKYGQNFLIDPSTIQKIVKTIDLDPSDRVIEIGSGTGNITEKLLELGAQVLCIELDPRLIQVLEDRFGTHSNFTIIEGDAAKIDLPHADKVIGNLPFSAAAPILFRLAEKRYPLLLLTFQQEFAQKMLASAAAASYGRLSVMSQFFFTMEAVLTLPPKVFYPHPKVVSQILKLRPNPLPIPSSDLLPFQSFITTLFCHRKRLLRKVILSAQKSASPSDWINQIPVNYPYQDRRIYSLNQAELLNLFQFLHKGQKDGEEVTS